MANKLSRNSTISRGISMLLAFAMLIGVLPSVAFNTTAKAVGTDLYYDFIKANRPTVAEDNTFTPTITYEMTSGDLAYNPGIPSAPWAFHSRSTAVDTGGGYFRYINNNQGFFLYGNDYKTNKTADHYSGVLKIDVTESGKYIPQINIRGMKDYAYSTLFTVSLLEYDSATDSLGDVIVSRDITHQSYHDVNHYVSLTDTPIELEKKEYALKISIYKNGKGMAVVDGFKLVAAENPVCTSIKIGDDEGLYTVKTGEVMSIPLSAVMSDESEADLSGAIFQYSTPHVVTASIEDDMLVLSGDAVGTTTLTVSLGNAMARANIKVADDSATPATLSYNFKKPTAPSSKCNYEKRYLELITFASNTAGAYGEVNASVASAPWAYDSRVIDEVNGYLKYNSDSYGIAMYHPGNFTLKIKVPADGKYLPKINLHSATGGDVTVKLLNSAKSELASKTIPVGTSGLQTISDAGIDLPAGVYYVNIAQATKAKLAIADAFELEYKGEMGALSLSADGAKTVDVGASVDLPLTLTMSDGAEINYSDVTASVVFDTEGIASATPSITDSAKIVFTGVSAGSTKATVTVNYGNSSQSIDVNITVNEPASTEPVTLKFDFKKGYAASAGNAYINTITYNMTTKGGQGEINTDIESAPWAFHSRTANTESGGYFQYLSTNYGPALYGNEANKTFTANLKVKVNTPGKYLPIVEFYGAYSNNNASYSGYSLSKYDSTTNAIGSVIASVNFNNGLYSGACVHPLSTTPIELDRGEYIFAINSTGGSLFTNNLTLIPVDEAIASKLTLGDESGIVVVKKGHSAELALNVTMSDGSAADIAALSFDTDFSKDGIATAEVSNGALKVSGSDVGSAVMTVKVGAAAAYINVKVVAEDTPDEIARDHKYDFKKVFLKNQLQKDYIKTITYAATTAGSIGEINAAIASDPWAYDSRAIDEVNGYLKYNGNAYGIAMYQPGSFMIKIKVLADGFYIPQVNVYSATNADVTVSLLGKDKSVLASKVIPVGSSGLQAMCDNAISLAAGEYYVKVEQTTKSKLAIIDGFALIDTPNVPKLKGSVTDGLLKTEIDGNVTLPIALSLSDESAVDYSKITASVEFSNANVAEALPVIGADNIKVSFTGIAAGTTTAAVKVTDGHSEAVVNVNIKVYDKGGMSVVRDLNYDFMKGWTNSSSNTPDYVYTLTYDKTESGSYKEISTSRPSDAWEFLSTDSTGGNNYFKFNYNSYGFAKSLIGSGSIKIRVPASGKYMPYATLCRHTSIPPVITLSKYDAENNKAGETVAEKTGIVIDSSKDADYAIADSQIYLEAGEYVVTVKNPKDSGIVIINGFKLVNLDSKLSVSVAPITVIKGESASAVLDVKDYDNASYAADDLTYNIEVADTNVATAELSVADGKLVVTAQGVEMGTTTATVNVSASNGKTASFTLPITVNADFELDAKLDVSEMLKVGEQVTVPVYAHIIRKGVDEGDAAVSVTATVNNGNMTAEVIAGADSKNNSIKLTGVRAGTSMLTVKVKASNIEKTFKVAMLVYSDAVNTTNSYKYMIWKNVPVKTDITTVDSFLKTMPNTGMTLREGDTDAWCFAGVSEGTKFVNYYDTYGSAIETGVGSYGAIKVRLPESGKYQIVSQSAFYCMAGIMRVYVAPADAENPRDAKWSVGSADNYYGEDKTATLPGQQVPLRTLNLDAGDYIVTWEIVGNNAASDASPRLYPDGVYFNVVSELPKITLNAGNAGTIRKFNRVQIPLKATVSDNSIDDIYGAEFEVVSESTPGVATVKGILDDKGKVMLEVEGREIGSTTLTVAMKVRGETRATIDIPVTVIEQGKLTNVDVSVAGSVYNTIPLHEIDKDKNQADLKVSLFDQDGIEIDEQSIAQQEISYKYEIEDESIASVDENGHILAHKPGTVKVKVTVTLAGITQVGEAVLNITLGKTRRSIYTEEKVAAMRANADLYAWANSARSAAISAADKYVGQEERLWNVFTTQELPRSYYVGYRGDPNAALCRYCGVNIEVKYGSIYHGWIKDAWNLEWKVKCPDCRRNFPSNDFGSFYKLGIDDNGNWNYELAKTKNADIVSEGGKGYLVNELYPEKGEGWGVDDGYGYDTGNVYADGTKEVHTYISFYNHWGIWHSGLLLNSITDLTNAYLYTGDVKYGRVGAIMLDRLADVYPAMDTAPYRHQFTVGDWYDPHGKVSDYIWENQLCQQWSRSYDAFWPMYEDSYVIEFLSEKAEKYNMKNDKSTASLIRTNCEDGILREVFRSAKIGNIHGNFGMYQSSVTVAAVALDTMPETKEMIDWVFRDGENLGYPQVNEVTGGNVNRQLFTKVDADGVSDEVSPTYSDLWVGGLSSVVNTLAGYDKYPSADLYNNPRFIKMLTYQIDMVLRRKTTPNIGDTGATAKNGFSVGNARLIPAFLNIKDKYPEQAIKIAQMIYLLNGNKVNDLKYGADKKDPESIQNEIADIINTYGEYDFDRSLQLTDYGFAVLKSGSLYKNEGENSDTQRAFWMFYGRSSGHGHWDALNLGIEGMGLDLAPELGYPRNTADADYDGWGKSMVVHNTVVVNDSRSTRLRPGGFAYHFDDSGRVKIMDAESKEQYNLDAYRRTVVSVDIDEEYSYGVDFFHIKGGNEHVYSFHALSNSLTATGLDNIKAQADADGNYIGSYQGANIAPGTIMSNGVGYNYLYNVNRAADVAGGNFAVDFKITDFRGDLGKDRDIHLKMTMVNNFDLNEVAIADGDPPPRDYNPKTFKFVLARRSGTNLNTLFTTVFEPYDSKSKIESIENVPVTRVDGKAIAEGEFVRAVKVKLADKERIDYVIYAQDNSVEYCIDNLFNVRGFVGVYTVQEGENVYSYVNDGDKIADATGLGAVTGNVVDFTRTNEFKNYITVTLNENIEPETLVGKYIYINKSKGNTSYEIKGIESLGEKKYQLYVGDVTTIDTLDNEGGFVYRIPEQATFRIPLPIVKDASPVFAPIADQSTEVGKEINFTVRATSPIEGNVTYSLVKAPTGAKIDATTGEFTWTPSNAQHGTYHIMIQASNGKFESIENLSIDVRRSTSGSFGGGGGGAPSTPGTDKPGTESPGTDTPDTDVPGTDTPGADGKKFVDLGNHKWAEDAIYRLVDAGVINGTGVNTYSPSDNISRADFATLVVRAFKFEAEAETFADVPAGTYYTETVGIAKAVGVVNGVSETEFAPKAQIKREDMMLMIYRALKAAGIELEKTVDVNTLGGMDEVSDYAKEAIEAVIGAGIIAGSNGEINPQGKTTRAEVAVVLDRIYNKYLSK